MERGCISKRKPMMSTRERIEKGDYRVAKNDDTRIRKISNTVFNLSSGHDSYKVDSFCSLHGVGPALASTILTFYNPRDFGVFDIHVWRELWQTTRISFYN